LQHHQPVCSHGIQQQGHVAAVQLIAHVLLHCCVYQRVCTAAALSHALLCILVRRIVCSLLQNDEKHKRCLACVLSWHTPAVPA
jgi:hypothetical protein